MDEITNISNEEDFELELTSILDDEDEVFSIGNTTPERVLDNNSYAELELQKEKYSKLEAELNKIKGALESGQKSNFLEKTFAKYSDIDDGFKHMIADVLHGYNQASQAELAPIYEYFDSIKKDIVKTQKSIEDVSSHVINLENSIVFDKLTRQYLQRVFKKSSVTEDVLESVKKHHFTKKEKDDSYHLKLNNIWGSQKLTPSQKDKLTGELIAESYKETLIKKQSKGKVSNKDPEIKKRIEKDPTLEKAHKKLDKELESSSVEAEETERPALTKEQEEARREMIQQKLNKLKRF